MRLFIVLLSLVLFTTGLQADMRVAHRAFESGNYKLAFKLLKPLAEEGNVEAQGNLAWLYKNGAGVDQDTGIAASWYRKAAEQGDALFFGEGKEVLRCRGVEQVVGDL